MKKLGKVGLALGSGAVLGAAHIGVLKAIEENNIEINYITGNSVGAFIGALYAFGKKWDEIRDIALELKWLNISSVSLSKFALLSNENLGELILEHIGDKNIEDAKIPLVMIATNISNGEMVVLDKGPVTKAVMASTCIPGIFCPVEINNKILVDGGIVENVPVKTIKKMGAEFVIGVDLNAKHTFEKPENIIDVILNSFHFIMQQSIKYQSQDADLLIKPDLSSFNRSDVEQVEELIEKGYTDAKKALLNLG